MTNPYSATYITAFNYFKNSVEDEFGIIINFGSEEEKSFKNFYSYISSEVENEFFLKNSSKKILEYVDELLKKTEKKIIIESHDSSADMIYYKLISKEWDLIITIPTTSVNKRITKKYEKIDKINIDRDKIALSIRAN
jgi:hypothetical protein